MVIHYAKYPRVNGSACGLWKHGWRHIYFDQKKGKYIYKEQKSHYMLKVTRTKKKVTCKNCLRTKRYGKTM